MESTVSKLPEFMNEAFCFDVDGVKLQDLVDAYEILCNACLNACQDPFNESLFVTIVHAREYVESQLIEWYRSRAVGHINVERSNCKYYWRMF